MMTPTSAPVSTNTSILSVWWRVLYTAGLLAGLMSSGLASGGGLGLAAGPSTSEFAMPGGVLLLLVLGRLLWVWRRPRLLTWPATNGLRILARLALAASVLGIVGVVMVAGSRSVIGTFSADARGAVGLVVAMYLLPFISLASLGLVVFEWARGWSARSTVPAADQALLATAAIVGALIAIMPAVSGSLFPIDSLTRSQYRDVLPWLTFALGLGALVVRGLRGNSFPANAVFSTSLGALIAVAVLTAILGSQLGFHAGLATSWLGHGRGLFVNAAGFAVLLAVVPASALAILARLGANRSGTWVARASIALPLVAIVVWLGIAIGTTGRQPLPAHLREAVLSDEQLAAQARHLQRRCPEAGTQVLRQATDVTELEIRFPDPPQPNTLKTSLGINPDASRAHDWFPQRSGMPIYERIVFALDGKRLAFGLDPEDFSGYSRVDSNDIHPRYVLTWRNLQTPQEESDGVLGNEMTIVDTHDSSVLARRVLFFKRTNEWYGIPREACGTLGSRFIRDAYAYQWTTTILIPKLVSAGRSSPK